MNSSGSRDGWIEVTDAAGSVDIITHVEFLQFADRRQSIVLGTAGDDSLNGTDTADIMWGAYGSDTLDGGAGNNSLYGGADDDVIRGGEGDDFVRGNAGDDRLDGGSGENTLSYESASTGVMVDLAAGAATGQGTDILSNFQRVNGSLYNDTLRGDRFNNRFFGSQGDDRIDGGDGIDIAIFGGTRTRTTKSPSTHWKMPLSCVISGPAIAMAETLC